MQVCSPLSSQACSLSSQAVVPRNKTCQLFLNPMSSREIDISSICLKILCSTSKLMPRTYAGSELSRLSLYIIFYAFVNCWLANNISELARSACSTMVSISLIEEVWISSARRLLAL